MSALLFVGSAAAPLVASAVTRAGDPFAAVEARRLAFSVSAVSALVYLVTGSGAAGAVALGAGSGWALMKFNSGQKGWP